MKNRFLIVLLLALSPYCYSSMYTAKAYTFEYNFNGENFPITISNTSYDEALEEAATECFNHYTNSKGNDKVNLPDDLATDLIDECTNPHKGNVIVTSR